MIEISCPERHPVLVPEEEGYSYASGVGVTTASAATDQLLDCPLCGQFLWHAVGRRAERVRVVGSEQLVPMQEAMRGVLVALAYKGEVEVDQLATLTGIAHSTIDSLLVDARVFEVYMLGDEPVSVKLTDYGRRLARIATAERAA